LSVRLNLYPTRASVPFLVALGIQGLAAAFFVVETLTEARGGPASWHPVAELSMAAALIIGLLLSLRELRRVLRRANEQASALEVVQQAFSRVAARQFDLWKLTPAERDEAQLSLKGYDLDQIGKRRGAAAGTIRAQFARIYAKSGVSNRAQFASVFLVELIGGTPQAPNRNAPHDL